MRIMLNLPKGWSCFLLLFNKMSNNIQGAHVRTAPGTRVVLRPVLHMPLYASTGSVIQLHCAPHNVLSNLAQFRQHGRHLHRPELHVVDRTILRLAPMPKVPAVEPCNPIFRLCPGEETLQLCHHLRRLGVERTYRTFQPIYLLPPLAQERKDRPPLAQERNGASQLLVCL